MKKIFLFIFLSCMIFANEEQKTNTEFEATLKAMLEEFITNIDKNIEVAKVVSLEKQQMTQKQVLETLAREYQQNPDLIGPKFDEDGYVIPSKIGQKVAKSTLELVGKTEKQFVFKGKRFNWDCSGTVMAAYFLSNVDISKEYAKQHGDSGVKRLYALGENNQTLITETQKLPEPGDLIYWDNTFDKNHNKKWDDQLTHIGVVIKVHKSGQITYVHQDYLKGVVVGYMNLNKMNVEKENGAIVNSPMRMKKDVHLNPSKYLSSHLFRGYSTPYTKEQQDYVNNILKGTMPSSIPQTAQQSTNQDKPQDKQVANQVMKVGAPKMTKSDLPNVEEQKAQEQKIESKEQKEIASVDTKQPVSEITLPQ